MEPAFAVNFELVLFDARTSRMAAIDPPHLDGRKRVRRREPRDSIDGVHGAQAIGAGGHFRIISRPHKESRQLSLDFLRLGRETSPIVDRTIPPYLGITAPRLGMSTVAHLLEHGVDH